MSLLREPIGELILHPSNARHKGCSASDWSTKKIVVKKVEAEEGVPRWKLKDPSSVCVKFWHQSVLAVVVSNFLIAPLWKAQLPQQSHRERHRPACKKKSFHAGRWPCRAAPLQQFRIVQTSLCVVIVQETFWRVCLLQRCVRRVELYSFDNWRQFNAEIADANVNLKAVTCLQESVCYVVCISRRLPVEWLEHQGCRALPLHGSITFVGGGPEAWCSMSGNLIQRDVVVCSSLQLCLFRSQLVSRRPSQKPISNPSGIIPRRNSLVERKQWF